MVSTFCETSLVPWLGEALVRSVGHFTEETGYMYIFSLYINMFCKIYTK